MFQSMMTKCGGRSATAVMAAAPSAMARTTKPASPESLAERFDCGNIPIDDQYLFIGISGKHGRRAIRGTELYSIVDAFVNPIGLVSWEQCTHERCNAARTETAE